MEPLNLPASDFPRAASLCAHAFFNDELDAFFFPNEKERLAKQKILYKYFLHKNEKNIYINSPKIEGLMIAERPFAHENQLDLSDLFIGLPLFGFGLNTIKKMMHFQLNAISIRKELIKDPYWYLLLVAVSPENQGKGFASKLLKPMLFEAEKRKEPFFLETHNPRNLPIYEKLGFRVIDSRKIKDMPFSHYCMIR